MPSLPSTLALTTIADGALATAADERNNFTAIQTAVNALLGLLDDGAAGQVLGGVGSTLTWGGPPAIAQATPAGATVTFSSIPQTFQHLKVVWMAYAAAETLLGMRFNGDTGTNYAYSVNEVFNGGAPTGAVNTAQSVLGIGVVGTAAGAYCGEIVIPNYAGGLAKRAIGTYSGAATNRRVGTMGGDWSSSAAITSISFFVTMTGVFSLYGLN